jgi:hypothetical protein
MMQIPLTNEDEKLMTNNIIGALILEPEYRFVDPRLLSEIVRDTVQLVCSGGALCPPRRTTGPNSSCAIYPPGVFWSRTRCAGLTGIISTTARVRTCTNARW